MDYEIILEGFPNLVDGLAHFFDEKCPNEIVKYRPDLRIIEPSYCKDGRIKHNKSIHTQSFDYGWRGARATARCTPGIQPCFALGQSATNTISVVKRYNLVLLPRNERPMNPVVVNVSLLLHIPTEQPTITQPLAISDFSSTMNCENTIRTTELPIPVEISSDINTIGESCSSDMFGDNNNSVASQPSIGEIDFGNYAYRQDRGIEQHRQVIGEMDSLDEKMKKLSVENSHGFSTIEEKSQVGKKKMRSLPKQVLESVWLKI